MDWTLFLEYIKILIWPLIASLSLFVFFRKKLANLIDRITIIKGPVGTEIRAEDQNKIQGQTEKIHIKTKGKINKLIKPEIENIRKEYEEKLDKEVKEKTNKDVIIKNLLDQISIKDIQINLEKIYNLIFGSQILLLKILKNNEDVNSQYYNSQNVFSYFENTKRTWPALQNWTATLYMTFLINNDLVIYNLNEDKYSITPKGRLFLSYLHEQQYNEFKNL